MKIKAALIFVLALLTATTAVLGLVAMNDLMQPNSAFDIVIRINSIGLIVALLLLLGLVRGGQWHARSSNPSPSDEATNGHLERSQDITETIRKENQLSLLEQMVDESGDAISIVAAHDGTLVDANRAFFELLDKRKTDVITRPIWHLNHQFSDYEEWNELSQMLTDGQAHRYLSNYDGPDGRDLICEVTTRYVTNPNGAFFVNVMRDVSERQDAQQRIQHLAYHDHLTDLPNRKLLSDRILQACKRAQREATLVAICYIDLDGFKPVNDKHGHHIGDQLLIKLAKRVQDEMRRADTLARLGGDEFVAVLSDLQSIFHAEEVIQRLLDCISLPFDIDGKHILVSASAGVTIYPIDDSDTDTLLRHADMAMYEAKETGKNCFCSFELVQQAKQDKTLTGLRELDNAIANNELILHYQPRISLQNGDVVGVEALCRWNHPDRGLLMPAEFIPIIENTPLELTLDRWVLEHALKQHMVWREQGLKLAISINVSPKTLQQNDFPIKLKAQLDQYPADIAHYLEIEILENTSIGNTALVANIMRQCSDLGVSFSLDDFGTGYSSVTYFHRLPVSLLKIDRYFVRDMLQDPQDQDIVEGVLRLAETLRRPVVAEGVESIEHALMLAQMGCAYAQGYGIAKPMPALEVPQWYAQFNQQSQWKELLDHCFNNTGQYDLNVAIFAHRRWLREMRNHILDSHTHAPPELNATNCQFNLWYCGIGKFRYGDHPRYGQLQQLHDDVHELAKEIIAGLPDSNQLETRAMLDALDVMGNALISALMSLEEGNKYTNA